MDDGGEEMSGAPMMIERIVAARAMVTSIRGAAIVRDNTSIPDASVPKGWSRLGGWRVAEASGF